jgi:hypothetical protein
MARIWLDGAEVVLCDYAPVCGGRALLATPETLVDVICGERIVRDLNGGL